MIVYRCLTSDEILSMINDKPYDIAVIKGGNTFKYEPGESYKHFFLFADHANYFMKCKLYPCIGQYVIPNDKINQTGFGYYGGVKTTRNDHLYHWYMQLPEVTVKADDMKKEYLYKISSGLTGDFATKKLNDKDNDEFNEPIEPYFEGCSGWRGYTDYSYADIYYEMVYQLAKKNDMEFGKVVNLLSGTDFHTEIEKYFEKNKKFFYKQTKDFVKEREKRR